MRSQLTDSGSAQLARTAARRLRRLVFVSERLIVLAKDLDSIPEPRRIGDLRLEDLQPRHLADLSQLNRERRRPWIDRRFARYVEQGFHGFVAYRADRLVGYYWWVDQTGAATFPDLRKLGLGIELGAGEVYGSDFFVLDHHRGGGVAAQFLFALETALRERGNSRIWGYVHSDNRPARWTYSLRGYSPMWTVDRRRVLIFKRTTRRPS